MKKNTKLKPLAVEVFGGRLKILGRTITDSTDIETTRIWAREIVDQLRN